MDSNILVVTDDVHALGIAPVGCQIRNLDVQSGPDALDAEINEINQLTGDASARLESDIVEGSRELFRRLGRPDQEPAGEQLVKLIEARGFNRNNNIVDAYNIVGARSGAVMGMHDAGEIDGPVTIRRAEGGETMLPIFHEDSETAAAGDLLWEFDGDLLALLGPVSRDADAFKVTEATDDVLLVVPGNPALSEADGRALCRDTFELIKRTCPTATMEFLDVRRDVATDSHTATSMPADD
ncbi:phenylalanine--tRNA ligase beta subunit-related protein [Halocatena pleomorpha]|uniref:B3/B4 tRNA-binding domain-containing protein n=1 Tax=Halocatena pleomorpha TaxID=1785090 RepID=A0A3P3R790_9EURY|nr:phenylalanine--tRNA ligase beta subunit-related protein [Halocatena pleomorpha]RRJ28500.1 hypothetical protein EIK79_15505 [Halocatena pleomorpha]